MNFFVTFFTHSLSMLVTYTQKSAVNFDNWICLSIVSERSDCRGRLIVFYWQIIGEISFFISHMGWCSMVISRSSRKVLWLWHHERLLWLSLQIDFLLALLCLVEEKQIKLNCNCDNNLSFFLFFHWASNTIFDDCNHFNAFLMANISSLFYPFILLLVRWIRK